MPEGSDTVLSPVQKGSIWRVRITWPNGKKSHFGKFTSEKDAIEWITVHPGLTQAKQTSRQPTDQPTIKLLRNGFADRAKEGHVEAHLFGGFALARSKRANMQSPKSKVDARFELDSILRVLIQR